MNAIASWTYADELAYALEEEREYQEAGGVPDWWTDAQTIATERYKARTNAYIEWASNYTIEATP